MSKIIWTQVDEAPALATHSLLPIVKAFTKTANIDVEMKDISLSGRILTLFSDEFEDGLFDLGKLVKQSEANIIKLPNISASIPQLKAAILELQEKGYDIPNFTEEPKTDKEIENTKKYKTVLGSAVNPVLREGNSDRRAPQAVKNYAKKFPHKMGKWLNSSKSHVATMSSGDFRDNEESKTITDATVAKITFINKDGSEKVMKDSISLDAGEIVDATFMSSKALDSFLEEQIEDARKSGVLFSLHLKATMMKVSDPIIFGHAVKVFYKDVIEKHKDVISKLNVNFNNGLGDLYAKIESLSNEEKSEIESDIQDLYKKRPDMAMVDSRKGITNLHVPSDVIIDASMPAAIRDGGKMWNKNDETQDTKFIIPDSTYAPLYDETIKNCIENGALDVSTMGTVPNVGLMAKKAEEYGSHPTTFEAPEDGRFVITDSNGETIFSQVVECGDIWRMVMVKDVAIKDWVSLAVERANATGWKTIFWLDDDRAHTVELKKKVNLYLKNYNVANLDIEMLSVAEAAKLTIERQREGKNTISVTGNILRDYNTDLYPILELGTSAKMLSIVPLMAGGGLFETGAGGSAPKHVQQLLKENYLRWDSLGEFLALSPSLEKIAKTDNNKKALILAKTLEIATSKLLENNKSPQRKLGHIDNRGSHFYLAIYWAEALSKQNDDRELAKRFVPVYESLLINEDKINEELLAVQGKSADIGGYYKPNFEKISSIMRPSKILNNIIDEGV